MSGQIKWRVITVPHHKSRRWYALEWCGNGNAPSYLINGRTMEKHKYRATADKRAAELNAASDLERKQ